MKIPEDWKRAIVRRVAQEEGLPYDTAVKWVEDVEQNGHNSYAFGVVAPVTVEFVKPAWDALQPLIKQVVPILATILESQAREWNEAATFAGTDNPDIDKTEF